MIINGGSRSNGAFFSRHLSRADHNERVDVVEIRGLGAQTISDAFREMKAVASGTRCMNYFYHANINTRSDETLTPEQWIEAVDTLEMELRFTGQPRFIVQHEKDGRVHQHVVWSRIDADSMTALSDSLTYRKHESAARALEERFGHQAVASVLVKNRQTERPERAPKDWETFRAQETRIDPKEVKRELTALWLSADSGTAFAAALEAQGYLLAKGDRRDFCVVDAAGDEHSLARRLEGIKAAAVRARMADVDRDALPSVAEARALARARRDDTEGSRETTEPAQEKREASLLLPTAFDAILGETAHRAAQGTLKPAAEASSAMSEFDLILMETVIRAVAEVTREAMDEGGVITRFRSWWGNMRDYVAGLGHQVHQVASRFFDWAEHDAPSGAEHQAERER